MTAKPSDPAIRLAAMWLAMVIVLGCASSPEPIASGPGAEPASVASAEQTPPSGMNFKGRDFNWRRATEIHPSVRRTSFALEHPRLMKGSCVRVDLSDPNLRFLVKGRDPDWGKPMPDYPGGKLVIRTRRQTVRSFMLEARSPVAEGGRGLDMRAAVNSTPWSPWEKPWNHRYADHTGLIVSDGVMVAPPNGAACLVIDESGRADFRAVPRDDPLTNILHAAAGFGFVLRNGEMTAKNVPTSLAPRTGFGLSRDRRFLYLFVVDGRQPEYSMGANTYEVGEWLRYYGAHDGLNMDGGGSTTLFCWDPVPDPENADPKSSETPNLHKLNHQDGNHERSVACPIGIYFVGGD